MSCAVITLDEHKPSCKVSVAELNDYPVSPQQHQQSSAAASTDGGAVSTSSTTLNSSGGAGGGGGLGSGGKKSSSASTNTTAPNYEQQCRSLEGISLKTKNRKLFEQTG